MQVQNTIQIQTSSAKVWRVLTESEFTKVYMFGCEVISDWEPGTPLLWKMIHEGKEMIPVKGKILAIQAPHLLKYSVIDAFASYADIPENHLHVTYELLENNGITTLTVTQDGFEQAAEGQKRYQDVYNNGEGWNPILIQMKALAESL
ncbi:MAG: SRPBCC domain-containing protein [Bacteroidia bacterium]